MAQVTAQGHLPVRRAAQAGQDATYYQIVTTKDTFLDTDTAFQATVRMTVGTTVTTILYADLSKYSLSLAANIDSKTTITQITPQGVIIGLDLTNATMINLILTDTRTNQVVAERHLGVYHGGEEGQPGAAAETFALIVTPQSVAYNPKTNDITSGETVKFGVSHTVGSEQTMLTVDEMTKYNCRVAVYQGESLTTLADSNMQKNGLAITPYHATSYAREAVKGSAVYAYKAFRLVLYVNDGECGQATVLMLGDGQAVYDYASEWKLTNDEWISSKAITTDNIEDKVILYTSTISQTAVQIQALVTDSAGTGGINITSNEVTLYGNKVTIKSSHGDDCATFSMINGQGMLNIDIIDAENLITSQLSCKRQGTSSSLATKSKYSATINAEGNGEYIIYHPEKVITTNGTSKWYSTVPAMRIAVEDVVIMTGISAQTQYRALIQAFDENGALICALTTKGWITPASTALSFAAVAIAVNSSGSVITTDDAAKSATIFASTTYYRIQADTTNTNYKQYNNCMTLVADYNTFQKYLIKNKTLYAPDYRTMYGLIDGDSSKPTYSRKRYTMDSNGVITVDTLTWQ